MSVSTRPFDATAYLDSDEAVACYIDAALEDHEPELLAAALHEVARALGMSLIAKEIGASRASLYETWSDEEASNIARKALEALRRTLPAMTDAAE